MNTPTEYEALLTAYREATGLDVKMSYNRECALKDIHDRGITPSDVLAVLRELKRRIDKGVQGYTDASIGFRLAMEDVDRLEERVLMIRQKLARLKGSAPRPDVQQSRPLPDGSILRVLERPEGAAPDVAANVLPGALVDLANRLKSA